MSVAKDHHHQDNRGAHEVMYVLGIVLGVGILTLLLEKSQDWRRSCRFHLRLVHQEMYPDPN